MTTNNAANDDNYYNNDDNYNVNNDYSDNNSEVPEKDKENPNRPFSSIRCWIGQRGSSQRHFVLHYGRRSTLLGRKNNGKPLRPQNRRKK